MFDFIQDQIKRLFFSWQQKPKTAEAWYQYTVEETLKELKSRKIGLAEQDVRRRRRLFGPNVLPEEKGQSLILLFLKQLVSPLVGILILAALISFFTGHLLDAYVIAGVIIINSFIGFGQEFRAGKSLASLKKIVRTYAKVYRSRTLHRVLATRLVSGDIVEVIAGDRIPADIRLMQAHNFAVDQAALTGESVPQNKQTEAFEGTIPIMEQENMAWMGTVAVRGKAVGIVVATGTNTQIGLIAHHIQKARRPLTVFQREIRRLSLQLLVITGLLSGLIFVLGLMRKMELLEIFLFTLSALVSLIPEGLPAVISIVLAVGVYRMARHKAIVRNLAAAETMGSATIICTDKTGTITRGEMMVQHIYTRNTMLEVTGEGFEPRGDFFLNQERVNPEGFEEIWALLHASTMGVDAELEKKNSRKDGKKDYIIIGDPTEGALVVAAEKAGIVRSPIMQSVEESIAYPFDSKFRWGGAFLKFPAESSYKSGIYIAGASEEVLAASTHIFSNGRARKINREDKKYFVGLNKEYSGRGLRIIAVAARYTDEPPKSHDLAMRNLTFLGACAMIDPPREGVAEAIAKAQAAGVRVMMITGDHVDTGWEIARQVGLIRSVNNAPLLGESIENMSDIELREQLRDVDVVARVTPSSKLRIVEALQADGHIVAMTGDGVNDAPALRQADIGIAMGKTGSDVAQDAAQVVLTDDDFSSIIAAMEEGRVILRNIRQTTTFLISTNVGEALIIIAALLFGLPLPLLPVQILFLNLVTDGFSDVALGMEGNHHDTLTSSEDTKSTRILSRAVLPYIFITGFLMVVGTLPLFVAYLPGGIEKARTIAFVLMAFFQLWNVLNLRSFKQSIFSLGIFSNPYVIGAIAISIGMQLAVLYTEIGRKLFSVEALGWLEWGMVLLVTSSIFIVIEVWKFMRRSFSLGL